ncbi:MAG: hypothetical protein NTY69_09905 [Methylococcales bacterium]|nr:hypothetical protein [Methylococcales bacterium]
MWLLNRLFAHNNQPTPRFAFQGTVNWMRGLAIICENNFSHNNLHHLYQYVNKRRKNKASDTLALESIIMSMHNLNALNKMDIIDNPYSIVRSAIIAWYYTIYYASKAMLAASSGSNPQTHSYSKNLANRYCL